MLALVTRIILLSLIFLLTRLVRPLFELLGHGFSGKDLVMLLGGKGKGPGETDFTYLQTDAGLAELRLDQLGHGHRGVVLPDLEREREWLTVGQLVLIGELSGLVGIEGGVGAGCVVG